MGQEEGAAPVPVAVVFSWETSTTTAEGRDMPENTTPRKAQAPARRLSVPPPPGRPSTTSMQVPAARSLSRGRTVRPEDDPFLAAYLACTKSTGGGGCRRGGKCGGAERPEPRGRRRFTWAGLGLSCKGSGGAVEQSMVKLAGRPELDPRDA